MKLSEIIVEYTSNSPAGLVVDTPTVAKYLMQAVRFYCGYADLVNAPAPVPVPDPAPLPPPVYVTIDMFGLWLKTYSTARNYSTAKSLGCELTPPDFHIADSPVGNTAAVTNDVELTLSELALIRPLFRLYVELENATHLEASRALGLDVYGRTVAEVTTDIKEMEAEMSHRAFCEPAWSL